MQTNARDAAAFTIVELLIVMGIIIVLAALVLATSGYVQKKSARSRAEAEIAGMSAALESYKADNGEYPSDTLTAALKPKQHFNPDPTKTNADVEYFPASVSLFTALSGNDANQQNISGKKGYFTFKPQMLGGSRDSGGEVRPVRFIKDPFGNSYGYSTAHQGNPADGYNPTFDLWSTGGEISSAGTAQWIKNW